MMAERHHDVETLNTAARRLLAADGTLTGPVLHAAGRDFQVGDEVITLTQAGHTLVPAGRPASAYIRTGTVGVVTAVHLADNAHEQALEVYFPKKGTVRVPWKYLTHRFDDGRDGGLGHAYAITAAKAQGATMDTARAVLSDDTTRPAAYVMLSRARTDLHAYVLGRADLTHRDDDETWLPAGPDPDSPLDRLADHLTRTRNERLATDHDPTAVAAHILRQRYTLAELTALRLAADVPDAPRRAPAATGATAPRNTPAPHAPRSAPKPAPDAPPAQDAPSSRQRAGGDPGSSTTTPSASDAPFAPFAPRAAPDAPGAPDLAPPGAPRFAPNAPTTAPGSAGLPRQVLLRRAELATEATVRTTARTHPPPALVERIGPRPASGPDRAIWDDTVTALAIYHARHQPDTPAHDPGPPPGATPDDRRHDPWLHHHDQATHLARTWANALPDGQTRTRFHSPREALPRARAIAGLHALLDHGHHPDHLRAALVREPLTDLQAGAAVLARRVVDLCAAASLDGAHYELPAPRTAQQEWNDVTRLLDLAETNHLTTWPTGALFVERRALGDQPDKLESTTDVRRAATQVHAPAAAREARRIRIDAALDRQTTHALHQARAEPAAYLTALLGPRPASAPEATAWDAAAYRAEHYRHHHLGLPHGTPAQPDDPDAIRGALGDRPSDPAAADAYDQAHQAHQASVNLGTPFLL
ncbi:hypothetical protein I6A81_24290 [Frankia sp. CN7]|uniref:Uncharacterized protein n=1 Tax=Frankia nepalensis TaxID=1836974 RepID=A0A937RLA9_9ACTN|nr:hypothetical protein [Frankia nepalensis]MBL7632227.1 hypothetical protein [Frankia nepalensis]